MEQHFQDYCEDKARKGDSGFAVAYALLELVRAQERSASALRKLGMADAATPLGAIEALIMQMKETGEIVAEALRERSDD